MATRLFTTGGTIDKKYNMFTGTMDFDFDTTQIPRMLKQARFGGQIIVEHLFEKDSLEMTDADRTLIASACQTATEEKIIITHGTDTMAETGKEIQLRNLANKTIVLTGAMIPYSVEGSDAAFNLGAALAYSEILPSGVYVAMNGQAFDASQVYKDRALGMFRELPNEQ